MSSPEIFHYGDSNTIHSNSEVNVEINPKGQVIAVWFRCMRLPFTQTIVDGLRAEEMSKSYKEEPPMGIIAIDFIDTKSEGD